MELRDRLSRIPSPDVPGPDLADSVRYLASDAAQRSVELDTYWPKWDSPWWHMLLLFELGEARQIPARAVESMVAGLDALPLHIFPIRPEDSPPGTDPHRDSSCHCALGCIYQVLAACGVEVDRALPWAEPWFVRYQMRDGGLNCDDRAYLVDGECASSMVATVAPLEAMLLGGSWSASRRAFVDRAASCLLERELRLGSPTVHNAEERDAAPAWLAPCFPRFYFYDVIRGLAALVRWAQVTGQAIPASAVEVAVAGLCDAFPDGVVRVGRLAHAGKSTLAPQPDGSWQRVPASSFPLLDAVAVPGQACSATTRQWAAVRRGLLAHLA